MRALFPSSSFPTMIHKFGSGGWLRFIIRMSSQAVNYCGGGVLTSVSSCGTLPPVQSKNTRTAPRERKRAASRGPGHDWSQLVGRRNFGGNTEERMDLEERWKCKMSPSSLAWRMRMRVCSFAKLLDILSVTVGICKPAEGILERIRGESIQRRDEIL